AAEIYTMLCDYSNNKKGKVTVKIDAIAASAASVVAMAGERVLMSPVSMLMIHDPMTIAMGNAEDMEKAITTLNEIKESIINAYQKKTGLSRNKISKLMSDETWLNAKKAVELGFADEILFADSNGNNTKSSDGDDDADTADHSPDAASEEGISLKGGDGQSVASSTKNSDDTFWVSEWQPYSTRAMGQAILNRLIPAVRDDAVSNEANSETADTEAVLESSLTATAEETPQEVQTQEEETPSMAEANTVSDTTDNVSTDEPDAVIDTVTDDTTNAEERQTEETQSEETAQTESAEPTASSDNAQDNVVDTVTTGNEQELGAEDSEPVTVIVTDDVATNNLPDDLKTPEEPEVPTEPKTVDEAKPKELTIGLDGKAKDGSMPYVLLEKQLQLLR
ncbi:MAG: ATP-dependent Clp protease proteolytic subunit, partial [Synergistaceae bacterium]|nr:ATP-dependent Clp protease proteolytic subunit [Synergistaceae bacterium]